MREMIDRLEIWLQAHRPALHRGMCVGAEEKHVAALAKFFGPQLPEAFDQFLRWRNGQPDGSDEMFFANYQLLSSKEIINVAGELNGLLKAGDFSEHVDWWSPKWVPFAESPGGDYLCIDLAGTFEGTPGQVLAFWHDASDRPILAPSFAAWLKTFVASLERALWQIGEDEFVAKDGFWAFWGKELPGYPAKAAAHKNAEKRQRRLSTRRAIETCFDPLEGPTDTQRVVPIETKKVLKSARTWVKRAAAELRARGAGSQVEGVFEIRDEDNKRVAYVVWGSRRMGDDYHDGMILGFNVEGDQIYKKKRVAGL